MKLVSRELKLLGLYIPRYIAFEVEVTYPNFIVHFGAYTSPASATGAYAHRSFKTAPIVSAGGLDLVLVSDLFLYLFFLFSLPAI